LQELKKVRKGTAVKMHDMKVYTGSSIIIKLGAIWKKLVSNPGRITAGIH